MFLFILRDLFVFVIAIAGLALPAWHWLGWARGVERLALALAAALLIGYLVIFGLYLAGLSLRWFWVLPAAGLVHALFRPAGIAGWRGDPVARRLLGRWLLLALWCLGWQGLVVSYSGGGWAGDWVEHYERAHFFLQHWPADSLFLGLYPVPNRPPQVNLWTAGLLSQTDGGFAHHQVFTTLLGSLVIFPLTVMLRRWRTDRHAETLLLILLMLSPLFVQNATFPWTKLASAFFVLMAITQLIPGTGEPIRERLIAGAVLLAGGMLAHYSAGPWICAFVVAGAWSRRHQWRERYFQQSLLLAILLSGLLFASWLGWALAVYGPATTFTANTAVGLAPGGALAERVARAAGNLWYTVTPIVAHPDGTLLQQTSRLGQWRDHAFMLLQLKLPFAFGSVGGAVILWLLLRLKWSEQTRYWLITVPLVVGLGTAAHSQADRYGLAHISLQPLVLLGLVWLAAEADRLPRWLGRIWAAGLAIDFSLGILLHFAVQSLWLDRWLRPGLGAAQYLADYTMTARNNWADKSTLHLTFLADIVSPATCWTLLLVAGLTAGAFYWRACTVPNSD